MLLFRLRGVASGLCAEADRLSALAMLVVEATNFELLRQAIPYPGADVFDSDIEATESEIDLARRFWREVPGPIFFFVNRFWLGGNAPVATLAKDGLHRRWRQHFAQGGASSAAAGQPAVEASTVQPPAVEAPAAQQEVEEQPAAQVAAAEEASAQQAVPEPPAAQLASPESPIAQQAVEEAAEVPPPAAEQV